jgi:hypothetical protein
MEYLVQRATTRFVCGHTLVGDYESRFGLKFGCLTAFVHDGLFQEVKARRPILPSNEGPFRVFLSGTPHGIFRESVRCLAQAFPRVAREIGRPLKLGFAGGWDARLLEGLGFSASDLEPLGFLPTKRDLIATASRFHMSFLAHAFDESYRPMRWDFPCRTGDYLLAGAPILAHGSRNSVVTDFFRQHRLPVACEDLEPSALAACITQIAGFSDDERTRIHRRYLDVVESLMLASTCRKALLGTIDSPAESMPAPGAAFGPSLEGSPRGVPP